MFVVSIVIFRLALGYLFGGTSDQAGYVDLWSEVEQHRNLYADSRILVWPPYWWLAIGMWSQFWNFLGSLMPAIIFPINRSFSLKLFYYAFEIGLACVIATYIGRMNVGPAKHKSFLIHAAMFLSIPATWIITALHGNFDVMPTFFVIVAFFLLEFDLSETSALFAALLIGFAIMARTFPGVYMFPVVTFITRRFRWQTGLLALGLCVAPSFLSLYPVYLMTPDAVTRALNYRGIPGGWWGAAALARMFISNSLSSEVFELSYPVFYFVLLCLIMCLSCGIWSRRIRIFEAGTLLSLGLFCFAPTISNQNFYFLVPWAYWWAVVSNQKPARFFLWFLSLDLFLIYIVVPVDLSHPIWFQWTYDFAGAGHIKPIASPAWLVTIVYRLFRLFTLVFPRTGGLDYNPFIQLALRMPVWGVLIWWFTAFLKRIVRMLRIARPNEKTIYSLVEREAPNV